MGKRGQITIYVIIAVAIVAVIAVILILMRNNGSGLFPPKPSMPVPSEYIEKCARDSITNAADTMLLSGGSVNPENFKMYNKTKIAYLCYYYNNYQPCIVQEPAYIYHLEDEIKNGIWNRIDSCFAELGREYKNENYDINTANDMGIEIHIKPEKIEVGINRTFEVKKDEEYRRFSGVKSSINSNIYIMARAAIEIINQEATYCHFETGGYSLLYPRTAVRVLKLSDGDKIYTITDKETNKELRFAIKSCTLPPA
jgi:hypothetical protein